VQGSIPRNRSGETASTLILIGLILQAVEVLILFGIGALFLIVPFIGVIVLGLGVIALIWVVLVYMFSYERTKEGDYEGARTPTLVFGILSLLTVNLISGILYIIAYVKLGDALSNGVQARPAWGMPPTPLPPGPGTKFCPACGRPNAPASGFCSGCGARLA